MINRECRQGPRVTHCSNIARAMLFVPILTDQGVAWLCRACQSRAVAVMRKCVSQGLLPIRDPTKGPTKGLTRGPIRAL